ncbi:MAG: MFS transporter, partial [Pseudomonadota bacterium]
MTDAAVTKPDTDRKAVASWMMYEWANQPFHTLIITFVFAPYFASHVASSAVRGQEIWGYAVGLGGIIIAVLAPICGAISDGVGPKKPWIAFFSIFGVVGSWMLWYAEPSASSVAIA